MIRKEADVVVVGGGISGSAAAYNLAKRGAKVVLLEKGEIASEGSGKTGAAVRQQGRHPSEIPLMVESMKIWERLSEELHSEIDFVQGGNMFLAQTEDEVAELERAVRDAHASGLKDVKILTPEETRKIIPHIEGQIAAAMFSPRDGHSDSVKTTAAFANAAKEYGAQIYTGCVASDVLLKGGKVSGIATNLGEIKTPVVVIAAGVWATRLAETVGVHIPVKIIRYTLAETNPFPPLFKAYIRGPYSSARQTVGGTIRLGGGFKGAVDYDIGFDALEDLNYWLSRLSMHRKLVKMHLDGQVMAREIKRVQPFSRAARVSGRFPMIAEPTFNRKLIDGKLKTLTSLMPVLKGAQIAKAWAGFVDLTPDMLPVLGAVERPKGLILAAGFSGHGYALGPITGRLISELILDGKPSLAIDAFRQSRFAEGKVEMPEHLV